MQILSGTTRSFGEYNTARGVVGQESASAVPSDKEDVGHTDLAVGALGYLPPPQGQVQALKVRDSEEVHGSREEAAALRLYRLVYQVPTGGTRSLLPGRDQHEPLDVAADGVVAEQLALLL